MERSRFPVVSVAFGNRERCGFRFLLLCQRMFLGAIVSAFVVASGLFPQGQQLG